MSILISSNHFGAKRLEETWKSVWFRSDQCISTAPAETAVAIAIAKMVTDRSVGMLSRFAKYCRNRDRSVETDLKTNEHLLCLISEIPLHSYA